MLRKNYCQSNIINFFLPLQKIKILVCILIIRLGLGNIIVLSSLQNTAFYKIHEIDILIMHAIIKIFILNK